VRADDPNCVLTDAFAEAESRAQMFRELEAWRRYSIWSCTRDNRTFPCGDCDGCRAVAAASWQAQA
jgi:7-cyano-7-deazaguanine synthase in queuosine biosynthesis